MKSAHFRLSTAAVAVFAAALAGCGERPAADTAAPATPAAEAAAAPAAPTGPQFVVTADAPALLALESKGTCSLENLVDMATQAPSAGAEANTYRAARGATYRLIGFSTDSEAGTLPGTVEVLLHGPATAYTVAAQAGLERKDVAEFFKKEGLANAGYQADAGFANVQPGRYDVYAINTFGDARVICPTHQAIVVE